MSDLIYRQEAVAHLQRIREASEDTPGYNEGFADGLDYCIGFISTLPSAEPERKKGKWIKEDLSGYTTPGGNGIWHCSECKHQEGPYPHARLTNCCPDCGARMEESA